MSKIWLKNGVGEGVAYNFPDFPVHAKTYCTSARCDVLPSGHSHLDLEFIQVLHGSMEIIVEEESVTITKGQAVFINSRNTHHLRTCESTECRFFCVTLHPLICSHPALWAKYVQPICNDEDIRYIVIGQNDLWGRKILELLKQIKQICEEERMGQELEIAGVFHQILSVVYSYRNSTQNEKNGKECDQRAALRSMIEFIKINYCQKISINDIAAAGIVCRSSCYRIFRYNINQTPSEFLLSYRLERSIGLLSESSCSITDIASLCGFSSASYFTEIFRSRIGMTPTQYRNSVVR